MEMPWVVQWLRRGLQLLAYQPRKFIDGTRCFIGNIDDTAVEQTLQGEAHSSRDIAMMDRADPLGWMPFACDRVFEQFLQMTVPVAVDERKSYDRPVEAAVSQGLFGCDLAGGIGELGIDRIVLAPGATAIGTVDLACARENEARRGRVALRRLNEILRPRQAAIRSRADILPDTHKRAITKEDGEQVQILRASALSDLPAASLSHLRQPDLDALRIPFSSHKPRILILYGSLRTVSYSRLLA